MVQRGELMLQYVTTEEQVADVLTKPLSRLKFKHFRDKLSVVPLQREWQGTYALQGSECSRDML
jgi:hypothetical protein